MVKITLYDKTGNQEIKLSKGKKFTLNKDNFKGWEKVEITEC